MDMPSIRAEVIAKILELSMEEVEKVLIFMAGLDAGTRIVQGKPAENTEPVEI